MAIKHNFKRHKYDAKPTVIDGIKFKSKKEAEHYKKLKYAKQSGEVLFFLREAPFHLSSGIRYVVDFVEYWANGDVRFVDVKGFKTQVYKLKKKMVESEYPITIEEA